MAADDKRITAYALGELEPSEAAEVEAMLADDEEGRRELEDTLAIAALLTEALRSEEGGASERRRRDRRRKVAVVTALSVAAAAAIAALCVGVLFSDVGRGPEPLAPPVGVIRSLPLLEGESPPATGAPEPTCAAADEVAHLGQERPCDQGEDAGVGAPDSGAASEVRPRRPRMSERRLRSRRPARRLRASDPFESGAHRAVTE